jgi:hypothetical protein
MACIWGCSSLSQDTSYSFYSLVLHPVARKDQYSINNRQSQPIPFKCIILFVPYYMFRPTLLAILSETPDDGLHVGRNM